MVTLKNDEMKRRVKALDKEGFNQNEISSLTGIPTSTLGDFLRKESHLRWWQGQEEVLKDITHAAFGDEPAIFKTKTKEIVGIIGDTHIPYELKGYLEFCKKTFDEAGVTIVVHIGDILDHHALSFHDSEPMLASGHDEQVHAKEALKVWYDAFPQLILIEGNHDLIPARQLKRVGLNPETWLRSLKEVYNMPSGWTIEQEVWIDDVLYHHGHTAVGVNGFRNDAKNRMVSTVTGHAHGNAGISATACDHRLVWGMAVGCGIDNSKMAFAYGKNFKNKPIVACGVVDKGEPKVFFMDLGEKH